MRGAKRENSVKTLARAFALLVTAGWSGNATAQDGSSFAMILPTLTHTDPLSMMLDDRESQEAERPRGASRRGVPFDTGQQRPAPDMSSLRYAPSKARRAANLAAFVQKTRAVDPGGAADLQKVFAEGDFIERIGALIAPAGLHIDNVADAYALWWITAWQAAHGRYDETTPALAAAVRGQAVRAISATGEMALASDAQKQELAEALWVQTALVEVAVEQAKGDPSRLRQIGDAVRQGAKGMGLNLDTIDLTSRGFVPASVSQNALPATAPKAGSAASYGALALAAGGIGVGGFLMLRQRRG